MDEVRAGGEPISGGDDATMPMGEAAALLKISEQSVRRWIDDNEPTDDYPDRVPVADRERDARGRAVEGSWRRPYRSAVMRERARRRGQPASEHGPPG